MKEQSNDKDNLITLDKYPIKVNELTLPTFVKKPINNFVQILPIIVSDIKVAPIFVECWTLKAILDRY